MATRNLYNSRKKMKCQGEMPRCVQPCTAAAAEDFKGNGGCLHAAFVKRESTHSPGRNLHPGLWVCKASVPAGRIKGFIPLRLRREEPLQKSWIRAGRRCFRKLGRCGEKANLPGKRRIRLTKRVSIGIRVVRIGVGRGHGGAQEGPLSAVQKPGALPPAAGTTNCTSMPESTSWPRRTVRGGPWGGIRNRDTGSPR